MFGWKWTENQKETLERISNASEEELETVSNVVHLNHCKALGFTPRTRRELKMLFAPAPLSTWMLEKLWALRNK